MSLTFRDKLAILMPPSLYYRRRIAEEARSGEPELLLLAELLPRGGVAIDAGANLGVFSYALAGIADEVIAFEPNPDCAYFARWMLRGRADVHAMALSDRPGVASFRVPVAEDGMVLHFAGSLKGTHSQFKNEKTYQVDVGTLDSFGVNAVRFIKVDVEGSEREVLDGARLTIARDRPVLLLELLAGTHADPGAYAASICEAFGYDAFVVQHGKKLPALPVIAALGKNTSWGTEIATRNVLFVPR